MKLTFGETSVYTDGTNTRVRLPDGSIVYGEPHDTKSYLETARDLGYGDDVARLNVEHEIAHVWLSWLLGLRESPVMDAVAHGLDVGELHELEEAAVMSLQRFANAAGVNLMDIWKERYAVDS